MKNKFSTTSFRIRLMLISFFSVFFAFATIYAIVYTTVREQLIKLHAEKFTLLVKDSIAVMDSFQSEVDKGQMTLEEAQEIARTSILGPKREDGTRDMSKTKMGVLPNMYVWASKTNGDWMLHPHGIEGLNLWDYQVGGKYTVRTTWGNKEATGKIVRELWQNKGEPIYTWMAWQEYYAPWGWVVGTGAREEVLYSDRLYSISFAFFIVLLISLAFIMFIINLFASNVVKKLKLVQDGIDLISQGNLTFRTQVNSRDEFGNLSNSFNATTDKLTGVIKSVREVAGSLATVADELSDSSSSISSTSSEQASNVEEMSASLEEVSAAILKNADESKNTSDIAQLTSEQVQEGGEAVEESVVAMAKISEKVALIEEVANQTNLLALNAAIEAARAGDQGKGFAVVAGEVRKLAEDAQKSSKEIGDLTIQSTSVSQKAGKLLHEIVPNVKKTADLFLTITKSSQEHVQGVSQVNHGMDQLNEIAQRNAASAEELFTTADVLKSQAKELTEMLEFFSLKETDSQ